MNCSKCTKDKVCRAHLSFKINKKSDKYWKLAHDLLKNTKITNTNGFICPICASNMKEEENENIHVYKTSVLLRRHFRRVHNM